MERTREQGAEETGGEERSGGQREEEEASVVVAADEGGRGKHCSSHTHDALFVAATGASASLLALVLGLSFSLSRASM